MSYNVVFGTRKVARATGGFQKHEDLAVATVEGVAEKGKNRRMLFNKTAMDILNFAEGATQEVVFVFLESDENGSRKLLLANATGTDPEQFVTYTTSKNKAAAYKDSKEKGKSVTSKDLMIEVSEFLSLDGDVENEYAIIPFTPEEGFPETGLVLFEFTPVNGVNPANGTNEAPAIEEAPVEESAPVVVDEVAPIVVSEAGVVFEGLQEEAKKEEEDFDF